MQKVFITQWSLVSKAGSVRTTWRPEACCDTSRSGDGGPEGSRIAIIRCCASASGVSGVPCRARYCGLAYRP
ncbi:hypothetical protein D9M69_661730 [compost metagenome]